MIFVTYFAIVCVSVVTFAKHSQILFKNINEKLAFGQIGGLAFTNDNRLVVFHRANRKWDKMDLKDLKPISRNVVTVFMQNTTNSIHFNWGKYKFVMPHGLEVDKQNNLWLTDSLLNSTYKYTLEGKLVLKANDFCGPTDISTVHNDPEDLYSECLYVADGYCNHRIVKMNATNGKFIDIFEIPIVSQQNPVIHSIVAYISDFSGLVTICVSIRDQGRVLCILEDDNLGFSSAGVVIEPTFNDPVRVFSVRYLGGPEPMILLLSGDKSSNLWTVSDEDIQKAFKSTGTRRVIRKGEKIDMMTEMATHVLDAHSIAVNKHQQTMIIGTLSRPYLFTATDQ